MNRRAFLRGVTAGGMLLTGADPAGIARAFAQQTGGKKPNFVFILADDWGWGDLGCYGNAQLRTPNLDRLAAQGTLFTQFYVANPVCSPSRTAFMTGHFPARHAIHGHLATPELNQKRAMPNWLDPTIPTVTRLLQSAGYATGHFGKWHLGSGQGAPGPDAYGIGVHKTDASGLTGIWGKALRAQSSTIIVDETMKFIEENRDRPFYVNTWLLDTHAKLFPTEEQMEPYAKLVEPDVPFKSASQIYYAAATDADKQIGRLLAKLDELGLADNTVVIFSSDNGPEDMAIRNANHSGVGSTGPFRGRKRSLYEGGVRVPFIVRGPGIVPAGRVDDASVIGAVDFLPTLCSLAGVRQPDSVRPDGEDMSAALRGNVRERTKPLMWEWRYQIFGHVMNRSPILAIRKGSWKLLMNPDRSRVELYNIPDDPSELVNVAERNPRVVEAMAAQALAWQKELPAGPFDPGAGRNDYPWPGSKGAAARPVMPPRRNKEGDSD